MTGLSKVKKLQEENAQLYKEIFESRRIIHDLCIEQGEAYMYFREKSNLLLRPKECVESGCIASCSLNDYTMNKCIFKNDATKCEQRTTHID